MMRDAQLPYWIRVLEVISNVELEQLILRYGENCKVLGPMGLRSRINERLKKSIGNYVEGA